MSEFKPYPKTGMPDKKIQKPLKRQRIKYKKKDAGQISVFTEIAAEREWICFASGQPLQALAAINFLHVLPKALNKFPKFKTYKLNIVLATEEIHTKWDKSSRTALRQDKRFDKLFELEAKLKDEYKQLYGTIQHL